MDLEQVVFNIIDLVWVGYGIKEDICTVNEDPKFAVDFCFKSQLL